MKAEMPSPRPGRCCRTPGVRDALATRPAEQRNALFPAFFQGLSHQEIATCLRTLLGTMKARIRRTLQILRQQLQGEPYN